MWWLAKTWRTSGNRLVCQLSYVYWASLPQVLLITPTQSLAISWSLTCTHTTYHPPSHHILCTHTHTHTHTQDEFVEYHLNHNTFPADVVTLPKRLWPDLVVLFWLSLLGIPAFLTGLYLAWVGAWFTLALIILAVILGEFSYCWILRSQLASL